MLSLVLVRSFDWRNMSWKCLCLCLVVFLYCQVSGLWETCLDVEEEDWLVLTRQSPWLGDRCYRCLCLSLLVNVWCEMTSHIFFVFFLCLAMSLSWDCTLCDLAFAIKLGFPLRWKMFVAIFLGEFCCEIQTTICITSLILLVSPSILNLLYFLQSWWRSCRRNGPILALEVHSSSHYLDASSI